MMNLVHCLYHDLRHCHPRSDHSPGWLHTLCEPKQIKKKMLILYIIRLCPVGMNHLQLIGSVLISNG